MRIACPDCNAVYELPPDRVRPGRGVKCAKCGGVWVPVALEDATPEIRPMAPPPLEEEPEPAVVPMAVPAPRPEPVAVVPVLAPPPRRLPLLLAWLLTVLVLVGLGWTAVTQRTAIIHAWPPAERAYQWVGLR